MPNSKRRRSKPKRLSDGVDDTWTYDIEEKLKDPRFTADPSIVERLEGKDVNVRYAQTNGFKKPILIEEPTGLGLQVPPISFSVRDASHFVGADRILDVMDVHTQTGERMPIREFVKYFETPVEQRSRLLNVLSLEFSNTPLADMVSAPEFVRKLDWIDCVWPSQYKSQQADGTNAMSKMMYPKVQKYFIMSVKQCYTDFHIDFGGTSVWYHVMKGEKVFWLIPPTDQNLMRFQEWTLSGQQNNVFFGDLVSEIYKIHLYEGNTFLIPSGWIHAVYTPQDTLVMGGNFLHSFSIPMQLCVFEIENNTQVPEMLRFPYYINIQWFAAERYVHMLSGKSFLCKKLRDTSLTASTSDTVPFRPITHLELDGLCVLLDWLSVSYGEKSTATPKEITNPRGLLDELKCVLRQHSMAEHESAISGELILSPQLPTLSAQLACSSHHRGGLLTEGSSEVRTKRELQIADTVSEIASSNQPAVKRLKEEPTAQKSSLNGLMETMANCLKTVGDSLITSNQNEMIVVESTASKAAQMNTTPPQTKVEFIPQELTDHSKTHKVLSGWCAKSSTVDTDLKSGQIPAGSCAVQLNQNQAIAGLNKTPDHLLMFGVGSKVPKQEANGRTYDASAVPSARPIIVVPSEINDDLMRKMLDAGAFRNGLMPDRSILDRLLLQQQSAIPTATSMQNQSAPVAAVKEEILSDVPDVVEQKFFEKLNTHLMQAEKGWLAVFSRLPRRDLCNVMLVCKQFHDWALTSAFWEKIKLTRAQLTSSHFTGLIKRQPVDLNLGWTYLPGKQLNFLLSRLEKLQRLALPGNNWDTIVTLKQLPHRSAIRFLDLRWAQLGYTEEDTNDLLSSLRQVEELWVSGCDIRESGVRYIANQFGNLHTLDLSYCGEVTDLAVELLCAAGTKSRCRLKRLSLAGCEKLSEKIFASLLKLENLSSVDLSYCRGLSQQSIEQFAQSITVANNQGGTTSRFTVVNNGMVKLING